MRAVYEIRDYCGDEVERIEIELPDGCTDPSDHDAETEALSITGYDGHSRCPYRALYIGYPIPPLADAIVTVEGLDRAGLIAALETIIGHLRTAPDYVSSVTCDDDGGRIE